MTRILHLSDTHSNHNQLIIPDNIDIVIHTGDATNHRDPYRNEPEMHKFLDWYSSLNIPNKVFVAGNHDTSIEKGLVTNEYIESLGIRFLLNEAVEISGFKIWGSPYVPSYGNWAFMKSRAKIGKIWKTIPADADIIATHGPPLGVLDITNRSDNLSEQCGDRSLLNHILSINPKACLFGHVHNTKDIFNAGTKKITQLNTIFSNAACVNDGRWGVITSHGNVIEL